MSTKVGVIHGRFQPFHVEHLTYTLEAFHRCDFLFIGITNPDAQEIVFQASDPSRSLDISNPLTFWERAMLIQASLSEVGILPNTYFIVPFPLHRRELLKHYVPLDSRFFMTIYDDWGRYKRDLLLSLGLDVEVMWERKPKDKTLAATYIRQCIADEEPWEVLVPNAVAKIMKEMSLDTRIRNLLQKAKSQTL